MNLSKTVMFNKSKEVWVMALSPPLSRGSQGASSGGERVRRCVLRTCVPHLKHLAWCKRSSQHLSPTSSIMLR